ncbi:phospholipase/carboxylesterase family protein [Isoalcanivorax pacificus W11-5]|uniref:Phospholipase/carboxylesterase family protein n=1 Tax=Isoalcanivorax pacificus W11-5 TaxID=391936 RepID=A0A0B4XV17_9GAMM|nr:dienelactone hydrolase family protein [Isoalcanivorax pacificus]AJD50102.1 phospholipase/carboxylesterase family protein [Isoalcanivorax pacificus W11-5]
MSLLSCVEIEPVSATTAATASVIWLHGLGADGHDFEPIVPALALPDSLPVRFLFPHAPRIPVTINGGLVMPAWYDILEMNIDRRIDDAGLRASADQVTALIERERERGIPAERIVLAGFSQGGAVAYEVALRYPQRLAGLLAMSTYFATADSVHRHPANAALPIDIHHGTRDPVVPEVLGARAAERLGDLGYPVTLRRYEMEHEVCLEQVRDISQWLQQRLA